MHCQTLSGCMAISFAASLGDSSPPARPRAARCTSSLSTSSPRSPRTLIKRARTLTTILDEVGDAGDTAGVGSMQAASMFVSQLGVLHNWGVACKPSHPVGDRRAREPLAPQGRRLGQRQGFNLPGGDEGLGLVHGDAEQFRQVFLLGVVGEDRLEFGHDRRRDAAAAPLFVPSRPTSEGDDERLGGPTEPRPIPSATWTRLSGESSSAWRSAAEPGLTDIRAAWCGRMRSSIALPSAVLATERAHMTR